MDGAIGNCAQDRLDPELLPVLVDERDHHASGRSSSAAKKADADFKIALARRNSRFSDSNSPIRARSDVVVPAAVPSSMSAWRTPLAHRLDAETQLVRDSPDRAVIGAQLGAATPAPTAPPAPSAHRNTDATTPYLLFVLLPWLHSRFQAQEPPTNPVRFRPTSPPPPPSTRT